MPAKLAQINTMTKEILAAIPTVGTKAPYLGKPVPPTRFESGEFRAPKTTIFSKTLRRAREAVGSALALEKIYVEGGTKIKDIWRKISGNIVNSRDIAAHGLIFKRDRDKMEDIQKAINNKKYALSIGGGRNSSIKGDIFDKVEAIIERYQKSGLLDTRSTIVAGVTYGSLINSLDELNILAKAQMAETQVNIMGKDLERDGVLWKINEQAANEIMQAYQCALRQKCNSSAGQFKKDLKNIRESVKTGSSGARQQIKIANEKLAATVQNTFKKTKQNTEDAETTALKNRFGLKTSQIQDAGILGLKSPRWRTQRQAIKEGASGLFGKKVPEEKITIPATPEDSTIQTNEKTLEFKTIMIATANNILEDADQQYDYVMMSDNKDILTRFGTLSEKLGQLKNTVGDKTSNDGLIKNFGEVCREQCSNVVKSCYY